MLCSRLRKITDDPNLFLQGSNALAVYHVSKEFQMINALGWVLAPVEDGVVLFWVIAGDEDVVYVGVTEMEPLQDLVDEMLEGAFRKPNARTRLVVTAVSGISSGSTGI